MFPVKKVLLFNPRAARHKARIPNSILSIAASINGKTDWVLVDGNLESEPWEKIRNYLSDGTISCFAVTVMPGPQLKEAIPFSKKVKMEFPDVKIVWGGYFASNQYKSVLESGFVDVVIYGPGDKSFPALLDAWTQSESLDKIPNLIYPNHNGELIKTQKDELYDQDELPALPYERLNTFYPISKYLGKTYLGKKTLAYHSSIGCPFTCSFCAVVPIYKARWKGRSAELIFKDVLDMKRKYGADAIEFHDNNFFVSEKRTLEFSRLIMNENMSWWGEGRIDTLQKYSDESLKSMRESGCKMIFFGAETGNDALLKKMDKGGTQSGKMILDFAARLKKFDIIPEYSFVLGTPAATEGQVWHQIKEDIAFIRKVKKVNPQTEIIIYTYSPVPTEGSELFIEVQAHGFRFPKHLEEWIHPEWENFDLRKNPLTPWLKPAMIDYIRNFEIVLNGYYPAVSDIRLSNWQYNFIRTVSRLRYQSSMYKFPLEIRALQKIWKYRQPELEGF